MLSEIPQISSTLDVSRHTLYTYKRVSTLTTIIKDIKMEDDKPQVTV